jgi:DNA polymerase III alpha subunit
MCSPITDLAAVAQRLSDAVPARIVSRRTRVVLRGNYGCQGWRAASCAGVVLVRQMPGAKGVVFITLSDETGIANVVVWPKMMERFRKEVMGSRLLLVKGRPCRRVREGVVHLVAEQN